MEHKERQNNNARHDERRAVFLLIRALDIYDDLFAFIDDSESAWICDGCGKGEYDEGGRCPLCCNNGGAFAPGSEECDFCDYADECESL